MLVRGGPPSETLLSERLVLRRLWRKKLPSGEEVTATVWFDNGEGRLEVIVHSAHAADVVCGRLAEVLGQVLTKEGATPLETV